MIASLAWRSLWRSPKRTAVTVLIVAVGVWAIVLFSAFREGWIDATRIATQRSMTGSGQIHATHYVDNPSIEYRMPPPEGELRRYLDRRPVTGWSARVRVPAVVRSEYRLLSVFLVGVDPHAERVIADIPQQIVRGRYLNDLDDAGVVLGEDLLRRLKSGIGKRVVLTVQAADGRLHEQGFTVMGAYGGPLAAQDQFAFVGRSVAQRLVGIGEDVSEIAFAVTSEDELQRVTAALRTAAPKLDVKDWTELAPFAYAMTQLTGDSMGLLFGIVFVLVAIGIVNAQLMAVFERTREFGLLQAVGMRPQLVTLQVTIESAMLVALGAALGAAAAVLVMLLCNGKIDLGALSAGAERFGAARIIPIAIDAVGIVKTWATVWVFGICAALWPALHATRVDPISAMRSE